MSRHPSPHLADGLFFTGAAAAVVGLNWAAFTSASWPWWLALFGVALLAGGAAAEWGRR